MNILILGGGGREHALAWAVLRNPKCDRLIVAPGNAGIAQIAETADLDILDGAAVAAFAQNNSVDLVIIGPEAPLAAGVADDLRAAGLAVFGPSKAAAQLESSKAFTKAICDACDAPTAKYAHFTDLKDARAYTQAQGAPIVIKADGLAAGKGVTVADDLETALSALDDIFADDDGAVVIEELLVGEEASFFVLCDDTTALPVGTAQDHKRAFDGDTGPNTGGMGAYSPAPVMTDDVVQKTMDEIVNPTLAEMRKRGTPFTGVLFVGLMIDNGQPKLIEYNTRFGDPETQCLMIRLGAQALDLIHACATNTLDKTQVNWADDHAMTIIMAAEGYPGSYAKGTKITGLDALPDTSSQVIFHAGTAQDGANIVANGGRVLAVTTRADTLVEAHKAAYAAIKQITWPEGFYRSDIGWRAL